MKLVSYRGGYRVGIYLDGKIYDLVDNAILTNHEIPPGNMADFLIGGKHAMDVAHKVEAEIKKGNAKATSASEADILAPVPYPASCRDGYAFRQHVAAARRNRKVEMIKEFDEYPVFYFTNHNAIQGPGDIYCMPDHFKKLDFELEAAVVIGKRGKNIKAAEADDYIAGYMIMNDMSARTLQMEEMLLNLGPAKGKDFSTVIGPWLVTPDELEPFKVPAKKGHTGNSYDLKMKASVNGKQVSEGNMKDMDWTFAEIIERCAYGVDLLPGDVIGSGTVGTGCFLELNGTGLFHDPNYKPQWLQEGDVVEMEIDGLGHLTNTIRRVETDFSLLALKKM
jgi:fumarylacetoacetate (FAA) hydrolase